MGNSGTRFVLGGWADVNVAKVTIKDKRVKVKVKPATLKLIFKNGATILRGATVGVYADILPEQEKLTQLEWDLGAAGYAAVPVTIRVGLAANRQRWKRGSVVHGVAFCEEGRIELYLRNILRRYHGPLYTSDFTPTAQAEFFSVLAHEVGHLIDRKAGGCWEDTTNLEKEERAEAYITARFGAEYNRNIVRSLYKG